MFSLFVEDLDFLLLFCFVITAAGVVLCGCPKSIPVHHLQCKLYFMFDPLRLEMIFLELRDYIGLDYMHMIETTFCYFDAILAVSNRPHRLAFLNFGIFSSLAINANY